ncbi:hypothetical protein P8452_51693 [Trifolium repens]|nr:hypothetical protein P8452_51693 [Trifolium repens]
MRFPHFKCSSVKLTPQPKRSLDQKRVNQTLFQVHHIRFNYKSIMIQQYFGGLISLGSHGSFRCLEDV